MHKSIRQVFLYIHYTEDYGNFRLYTGLVTYLSVGIAANQHNVLAHSRNISYISDMSYL